MAHKLYQAISIYFYDADGDLNFNNSEKNVPRKLTNKVLPSYDKRKRQTNNQQTLNSTLS